MSLTRVRTTLQAVASVAEPTVTAQDYAAYGWTVTTTANEVCLVTDDTVSGIEVSGKLAEGIRRYLRANNLTGPIIDFAGTQRREIHLVTGARKAELALAALRDMGATLHVDGAVIPLPSSTASGAARWSVAPCEARWTPPAVAISAAARAVSARAGTALAARIAS
jgi:hypothetical protein